MNGHASDDLVALEAEIAHVRAAEAHWANYYRTCPCGAWTDDLLRRPHVNGCPVTPSSTPLEPPQEP